MIHEPKVLTTFVDVQKLIPPNDLGLSKKQSTLLLALLAHQVKGELNAANLLQRTLLARWEETSSELRKTLLIEVSDTIDESQQLLKGLVEWLGRKINGDGFHLQHIRAEELLQLQLPFWSRICKSKKVDLHCETRSRKSVVMDQHIFGLIFQNLVSNAVKQSKPGQKVTVYCRDLQNEKVSVGIRDEAGGLSQEIAAFFNQQVSSPQSLPDPASGIGLGLFLSRTMVAEFDMELRYTPVKGGSQFDLELNTSNPQG